jgi:trypsin
MSIKVSQQLYIRAFVGIALLFLSGSSAKPNNKSLRTRLNNSIEQNNTAVVKKVHVQEKKPAVTVQARIVGGRDVTKADEYPFLGFPAGKNNCGATLIAPDIMLSAASCRTYFKEKGAYIGGNSITGNSSTKIGVDYEVVHPEFNSTKLLNDIMIIKLSTPSKNALVKLNDDPKIPRDSEGITLLGYGALEEEGTFSYTLQKSKVLAAPANRCYLYSRFRNDKMICSWFPAGGRDSCVGDSGGPVLTHTGVQIGIISFGQGCARVGYPSVNTRVSFYKDWIEEMICKHSDVKKC